MIASFTILLFSSFTHLWRIIFQQLSTNSFYHISIFLFTLFSFVCVHFIHKNLFLFMIKCQNLFLFVIICENHFLFMIICENPFLTILNHNHLSESLFICSNLFLSVCIYLSSSVRMSFPL